MTTFTDLFTGVDDRSAVLTEILRRGNPAPGTTLIAHVDRASHAVLDVRSVPTPLPVIDASATFSSGTIARLSDLLRQVARELAPQRSWAGSGWSPVTGELVTVVCREGAPVVGPVEAQFYYGWRNSNHLTAALDGDVYVVTPRGWAGLFGAWAGPVPALPAAEVDEDGAAAVRAAELVVEAASLSLLEPEAGECLLCYVHRMISAFGCDTHLRFATLYRDVRAPRATGLERRLGRVGGFCDCEIFLNGYELRPAAGWLDPAWSGDAWDADEVEADAGASGARAEMPACLGVRTGSTQPCDLWWRLARW